MTKAIVVAGCHRSLTSGVARALHRDGIPMGGRMKTDGNGGHGFYEDYGPYRIDEAILAAAGGTWDRPPSHEAIMEAGREFVPQIIACVKERQEGVDLWGFKEPRLCLTLPLWLPFLPVDTHIVGIFRNPQAVARSLCVRDKMNYLDARMLVNTYNRRLLDVIESHVR